MNNTQIAIIGGGISGVYAAWRLLSSSNPPEVALFESSSRLGGRIDTAELPVSGPAAKVDLGAMRFLPSMQMVSSLLKHLGIAQEPFPGVKLQQAFLRGMQIDMNLGTGLPYRFAPGEPQNPGELLVKILSTAVPGAMNLNAQQWRAAVQNTQFKGRELWRWAVHNVAEECISNEAFEFLSDISGLDSALLTSNAAIGVRCLAALLPDLAKQQVFRPVEGFGSVVAALTERLSRYPACNIHTRMRLVSLERVSGRVSMKFEVQGQGSDRAAREVIADHVILALPRRALELIDLSGLFPAGNASARKDLINRLADVNGIPAFKLCVVYDPPWWQGYKDSTQFQRGWKTGYAVTDLPLRQVFFGLGLGVNTAANERVLLATYADTEAAQYWRAQTDVSTSVLKQDANGELYMASPGNLQDAVHRQLRTLLQVESPPPQPRAVGFMNWSADPFGGGWHEWVPGVDVTTAIPAMRHPVSDVPVYICGEAYSWFQSWIEGALMSAERLLQDHFHMAWPAEWLPRDYDLGP